jgi:hypothetical protein
MPPLSARSIFQAHRRTALPAPFATEKTWFSGRRYLLTAGFGARFRDSARRLKRQAEAVGWFDAIVCITDDTEESWVREFLTSTSEFRREHPQGFGLWYWKPYLTQKVLSEIETGAHLYYLDAGCELSEFGEERFKALDRHLRDHGNLFFTLPFTEGDWTQPAVLARFGDPSIASSPQVQATWFGLANVESARTLAARWWQECSARGFEALKEADNTTPVVPGSGQHRHDQSVLSCLVKTHQPPIATLPWEDFYAPWLYTRDSWVLLEPVHALRHAGARSALDSLIGASSLAECRRNLERESLMFRSRSLGRRIYRRLRDEITFLRR